MKEELIFNTDLHFEHESWIQELDFWQDELESFQKRLNEMVMQGTEKEMLTSVEKFQNQLNIHEEVMNSIRNQIQMHESNIADHYQKNEDSMNRNMFKIHLEIRKRMENQRDIINDMKKNLFHFLTKYI
ncbi:MAG: hypothetical protein WBV45_01185 [Lutimonas sp.]